MKTRTLLILVTAVLLTSGIASAAILNSAHDLSVGGTGTTFSDTTVIETCAFCHTPHQAAAASAQDPLWNHTLSSTASYGVYGSDTLDATPTALTTATAGSATVSHLCLSCHDGTVGLGSMYNPAPSGASSQVATNLTGAANIGTSLVDDHPVNFTYDGTLATNDGELATPDSADYVDAGNTIPLFGGTLQCASCHDPHTSNSTFLVVASNADSALCTSCHNK